MKNKEEFLKERTLTSSEKEIFIELRLTAMYPNFTYLNLSVLMVKMEIFMIY